MSTVTTTEAALANGLTAKLRKTAVAASFSVWHLAPKVLNLRRNERTWVVFRTALGFLGAALVILPLGFWSSYPIAIIGLAMFTTAILLPPAEIEPDLDMKARELGALAVVDGGLFEPGTGLVTPVQLFVGRENLWALNPALQPVLVLPVAEITSAHAEELTGGWILNIRWMDRVAVFAYSGIFAQHLASTAEAAIRGVMHDVARVVPRRRAASA